MYKITYIHRGETKENSLYIPGDADYCLTDAQLDLEMGKAGELNISIPYDNPARQDIECLTDEVIFYRDDEEIWRGRPVTIQVDFDRTGALTCEGILAYLYDTYYEPFEFEGSPNDLFKSIINNHNSHVDSRKQFTIGEITVTDPNDYINRSSIEYDRSLNVLTEKLINDSLGGYFRVRVEGSTRYIDYLSNYNSTATQAVEFGENILDIAEEIEYSELATVILPLGAKLENEDGTSTDEYTTIASVNNGSIYYQDSNAVNTYGWICVCVEWEDVTLPSNLLDKAKDYLGQVTNSVASFTVNAVDLSLISSEEPIDVGDYVRIRSTAHGINNFVELTARTIYPLAPENDVLQFGAQSTLTGSDRNTTRAIISAINSQATRITHLSTDVLDAIYANIQYLAADIAYIETAYVTTEYVDELVANEITAAIINAGFLTADSAVITDLTAFAANIYTLLGGEGAFGELETVHLTSDNAVIDTAVIINAIAGTILADMIEADYIDTDLISIHSEDGTLWIDGSTILIYDANGNPRIQIGLDELGDYNLALWDEDGNCMWNATGATEYGLNDGIIRDITVADDANISGYKLNIEEICSIINSDGAYEIDASSVTINGQTLDAWYGVITEEIEGLEGLSFDGLISVEPWFCLWYSDTISPDDETGATICGQFLCGQALCGHSSSATWVDYDIQTEEGLYKWVKWKGYYADGHTEWSIPYCLTDGYLRTTTGVLQTELEVVQGWISERVWYTEIIDAVNDIIETDVWAELNIWLNGIELEVGDMRSEFTDQYETLETQVSQIVLTTEGITSRVESTEQRIGNLEYAIENLDLEGVSYFETYFCLWDSATEAPPDDADWTLTDPQAGLGEYKWARYLLYYEDGHTEWTTPYCLTDDYIKTEISLIEQTATSISESVNSVITWLGDDYYSSYGLSTCINQYVENSRAEIMLEVSSEYATTEYVTALLNTLELDGVVSIETYYTVTDSSDTPPETGGEAYTDTFTYSTSTSGISGSLLVPVGSGATKVVSCTVDNDNIVITDAYISGTSVRVAYQNSSSSTQSFTVTVVVQFGEGAVWSTDYPEVPDGSFLWVAMLLTYTDGHTAWTEPFCVTADIDLSDYATITYTDAQIKAVADDTQASIDILAQEMTSMGDEWSVSVAEIYTYVDKEMASISLEVTGGIGNGSASITLVSGDNVSAPQYIDLSEIRQAFADDWNTYVEIDAGTVAFVSNTLVIMSDQFTLDEEGNATFSGHLSAPSGTIGGWEIGSTSLYNGTNSMSSTVNGTFLGATSGIRQYQDGDYINITEAALTNGNADNDKTELTDGKLHFTHNGTYLGYYGTSATTAEPNKYGLAINAEYATSHIGFAHRLSPNDWVYEFDYIINWGLDESVSYTQRHIFYNSMMVTGGLTVGNRVYAEEFRVGTNDSYSASLGKGTLYFYDDSGDRIGTMIGTTTAGSRLETIIAPDKNGISWGAYSSSSSSETSWSQKLAYMTSSSGYMEGLHTFCNTDLHNWYIYPYYNSYPSLYITHGSTSSGHFTGLYGGAVFVGDGSVALAYYGSGNLNAHTTLDMHNYDIVNQSDVRLKENITDTTVDALNVINSIDLKAFDWIETGTHKDIGIIANQLKEVAPELITETDGVLGIVQSDLIYYALKAIQELSEKMGLEYNKAQYAETYSKKDKQKLVDKLIQAHTVIEGGPEPAPIMEE